LTINFNGKPQERQDKPESIDEQLLRQHAEVEKEQPRELNYESEASDSENDDCKNDDNGDDNGNGKGGCTSGNGNGPRVSVAERLVELVTQNSNAFFKDQYDTPYACIHSIDHYEIVKVESNKFKRHLVGLYFEKENKVANAEAVSNAVQVLQARAEYRGDTIPLAMRVAWYRDNIYYDLTNAKWQSVKITNESWSISNETPTPLFMRYNQVAQVQPSRDYEPDVFDRFIQLTNLKREEDRFLLKVYIISLFIPGIQHVILQIHGEKGGAKSMLETLIKDLVDPAKPRLLSIHNDRMEFIQQLAHNYIAYYDNLKHVPTWLSDEACRAVTGSGSTKRKLYSDDEDIVYEYRRCLGFNGINIILTEPDALDRSITIEQDRIENENRRAEQEIISDFQELRPKLLGYILDTLVKTLQIKPAINLGQFPRMADFALWGEAIARALGCKELEFIKVYNDNIGKQNIEAMESNTLGQAISRFLSTWYNPQRPACWFGTTSDLLDKLTKIALEYNINTSSKSWPKAANSLSRRLKSILSNIREGLEFELSITRNTTGKYKGVSAVKVWKIPSPSSPSSPDQNHAQNQDQNGEDTKGGDALYPHQADERSLENHQNRAQNKAGEGSEGSEDTYRTFTGASTSTVYRLGYSDIFACHSCKQRGDIHYMKNHICSGKKEGL
jgi:hypothetical protein